MLSSSRWRGNKWKGEPYLCQFSSKKVERFPWSRVLQKKKSMNNVFADQKVSEMLHSPPSPLRSHTVHEFTKGLGNPPIKLFVLLNPSGFRLVWSLHCPTPFYTHKTFNIAEFHCSLQHAAGSAGIRHQGHRGKRYKIQMFTLPAPRKLTSSLG